MEIIFNNLLFYTHCKIKVTYLQTTAFFSSKSTPLNILDLYFTQTRRQFSKTCSTVAERTVPACKQAIFTTISVDISFSPLPSHSFPFLLLRWQRESHNQSLCILIGKNILSFLPKNIGQQIGYFKHQCAIKFSFQLRQRL